jgi:hypothetical protein
MLIIKGFDFYEKFEFFELDYKPFNFFNGKYPAV